MTTKKNYFSLEIFLTQVVMIIVLIVILTFAINFIMDNFKILNINTKIDKLDSLIDKLNSFSFPLIWGFLALYSSLVGYMLSFKKLFNRLKSSWNNFFNRKLSEIENFFYAIILLSIVVSIIYLVSILKLLPSNLLFSLSIGMFITIVGYIVIIVFKVFIFFFKLLKVYLSEGE